MYLQFDQHKQNMHTSKFVLVCMFVCAFVNGKGCLCVYVTWVQQIRSSPGFVPLPYSVPVTNLWSLQRPQSILTPLMETEADPSCTQFPPVVGVTHCRDSLDSEPASEVTITLHLVMTHFTTPENTSASHPDSFGHPVLEPVTTRAGSVVLKNVFEVIWKQ